VEKPSGPELPAHGTEGVADSQVLLESLPVPVPVLVPAPDPINPAPLP
jgi:hypothetical protein